MQAIRNIGVRCIVLVVALQILNMSIDIPTAQKPCASAKDYNYIDTYIEYITEVVLKYENAIPEQGHRQHKQFQLHKHIQIICQPVQLAQSYLLPGEPHEKMYYPYLNRFAYQYIKEINPPPPKFS